MLYAYHHYREELQPEKEFEEPARIAGVLIDRPESAERSRRRPRPRPHAEGGFVRGTGAADAAAPTAPASRARSRSRSRRTIRRRVRHAHPVQQGSRSVARLESDRGGTAPARAGGRPHHGRADHLRQPRPDPRHPAAPVRPTLRTLPNSSAPPQAPPPSTFLPTSDSTGMIEIHLVEIDEWS